MIAGRSVLAIIPARAGSKGLKDKNIRPLCGKPLLAWTIDAAKKSKYLDRIILSSDSDAIIKVAQEFGCDAPFQRPAELSGDTAGSAGLVLHALQQLSHSHYTVLLQPTSPLRNESDIDATIETCFASNASTATTITTARQSPFHMYFAAEAANAHVQYRKVIPDESNATRRQDNPPVYILNGAVYVFESSPFSETGKFVDDSTVFHRMPEDRSVDIDTLADFKYAELLLKINQEES
jgi:CMP-N,N'-diacetyllegionaminic acid synthase